MSTDDSSAADRGSGFSDGLGVLSSGAPRVDACIEAVMAKHPTIGGRADQRYFETVHQELAPLARELERLGMDWLADRIDRAKVPVICTYPNCECKEPVDTCLKIK